MRGAGGFVQSMGLLLPLFARGAVFEGQDFAEGAQFILVPLRDLPPGADAVCIELLVDDFFDAFDLREIVVRHTSERSTRAVKPSVKGWIGTMRLTWMNSSSPGSMGSVSG